MLEISNSKYSVPVLDAMFAQPIFQASSLLSKKGMPQRQVLMRLLALLVEQKMLIVLVEGRGRRPAVYSLQELVKLCDSKPPRRSKVPKSGITVARTS
jgi:hypothetical protein